jgi:hypothetical protein
LSRRRTKLFSYRDRSGNKGFVLLEGVKFSWLGVIAGLYIILHAKRDLGVIRGLLAGEAG